MGQHRSSGLGPVTHLIDVPEPLADVLEALGVGDVVHQHDAHGPSVVGGGDGVEALLPRRVPVGDTTVLQRNHFLTQNIEFSFTCFIFIGVLEGIVLEFHWLVIYWIINWLVICNNSEFLLLLLLNSNNSKLLIG